MDGGRDLPRGVVVARDIGSNVLEDLRRLAAKTRGLLGLADLSRHLRRRLVDEAELQSGREVGRRLVEERRHELLPLIQFVERSIRFALLDELDRAHLQPLHLALEQVDDGPRRPKGNRPDIPTRLGLAGDRGGQLLDGVVAEVHAGVEVLLDLIDAPDDLLQQPLVARDDDHQPLDVDVDLLLALHQGVQLLDQRAPDHLLQMLVGLERVGRLLSQLPR